MEKHSLGSVFKPHDEQNERIFDAKKRLSIRGESRFVEVRKRFLGRKGSKNAKSIG
jgi:hypothetical protein